MGAREKLRSKSLLGARWMCSGGAGRGGGGGQTGWGVENGHYGHCHGNNQSAFRSIPYSIAGFISPLTVVSPHLPASFTHPNSHFSQTTSLLPPPPPRTYSFTSPAPPAKRYYTAKIYIKCYKNVKRRGKKIRKTFYTITFFFFLSFIFRVTNIRITK